VEGDWVDEKEFYFIENSSTQVEKPVPIPYPFPIP
jgi:hypothetical protein